MFFSGWEVDESSDAGGDPGGFSAPATDDVVSESDSSVDLLVSECYKAMSTGQTGTGKSWTGK